MARQKTDDIRAQAFSEAVDIVQKVNAIALPGMDPYAAAAATKSVILNTLTTVAECLNGASDSEITGTTTITELAKAKL